MIVLKLYTCLYAAFILFTLRLVCAINQQKTIVPILFSIKNSIFVDNFSAGNDSDLFFVISCIRNFQCLMIHRQVGNDYFVFS